MEHPQPEAPRATAVEGPYASTPERTSTFPPGGRRPVSAVEAMDESYHLPIDVRRRSTKPRPRTVPETRDPETRPTKPRTVETGTRASTWKRRDCPADPPGLSRRLRLSGAGAMESGKTVRPFAPELRERAVRMVRGHRGAHGSRQVAIQSIAAGIGCGGETARGPGSAGRSGTAARGPGRRAGSAGGSGRGPCEPRRGLAGPDPGATGFCARHRRVHRTLAGAEKGVGPPERTPAGRSVLHTAVVQAVVPSRLLVRDARQPDELALTKARLNRSGTRRR